MIVTLTILPITIFTIIKIIDRKQTPTRIRIQIQIKLMELIISLMHHKHNTKAVIYRGKGKYEINTILKIKISYDSNNTKYLIK
jgi:hypothetical protein